jgi:septal ring factor EnvC (AmiA/AmiB activator)
MFSDEEKRFLLALLISVLFAAFCCQVAYPQEYTVTEQQLQRLETVYQNYKADNQSLHQQVQSLTQKSEDLKTQLKAERETSQNLNVYCQRLEISLEQEHKDHNKTVEQLQKEKLRSEKKTKWIFILAGISALELFLIIGYILLRKKLS